MLSALDTSASNWNFSVVKSVIAIKVDEALKRFLVEDGIGREVNFWKFAQALSALYPGGSQEKRWVDGVLARKKGLGL